MLGPSRDQLEHWRNQPGIIAVIPVHDVGADRWWVHFYVEAGVEVPAFVDTFETEVSRLPNWSRDLVWWTGRRKGWMSCVALGGNLDQEIEVWAEPDLTEQEVRERLLAWYAAVEAHDDELYRQGWDVFVVHVSEVELVRGSGVWFPAAGNLIVRRGQPSVTGLGL